MLTLLQSKPKRKPDVPARFQVGRRTLLLDRFMNQFIKIGGVAVIVAVFGIFVFILLQIAPLFQGAEVEELRTVELEENEYVALGIDEWGELPFVMRADGTVVFRDLVGERGVEERRMAFLDEHGFASARYDQSRQRLAVGTVDGKFSIVDVAYRPEYTDGESRRITAELEPGPLLDIGRAGVPVASIAYADAGSRKLAVATQVVEGRTELHAVTLSQRRSLMGGGKISVDDTHHLTELVEGSIDHFLLSNEADSVVVTTDIGEVFYLFLYDDGFRLRQRFAPFAEDSDSSLSLLEYVFGDVTLIAVSQGGTVRGYSLFLDPESGDRLFAHTKSFPNLSGPAAYFASSARNKAFLLGTETSAHLMYSTTESTRWQKELSFPVERAAIGGKYDQIVLLDEAARMHLFALNDPHPEASFKAFFGKLWYEGASEPSYEWQSTGGSDQFEPKLSLVPLIIGSLKGTVYALLFAVPIAILAAIYTSQFLKPEIKTVVKPTMEIMASLPSVVLGFLAALWLAPIIETRVPSILVVLILVPLSAVVFGSIWSRLPAKARLLIPNGSEFLVFMPVMLLVGWLGWQLGPVVESVLFVVPDPSTGVPVADFRLWWPAVTGTPFEQRNSMVVGFMMGFAVIPIIFTISEDALSNVPQALKSGSLALGASRWQTACRIVLPTASAGIFSALMIGLGRAVGETMIVVMATGNTPIMEWNIFSGMRTLSANIAVELPEAPHHGTLYRTLFLGAMVLFLMTFFVNTIAEVMRQRLRDRYKTVD